MIFIATFCLLLCSIFLLFIHMCIHCKKGSPCKAQADLKLSVIPSQHLVCWDCSITGVIWQRLNSRNFSTSSLATCSNVPNKEPDIGRRQRKEVYYTSLRGCEKCAESISPNFQGIDPSFTWGMVQLLIISGLVRIRKSLVPVEKLQLFP
jgi:hypothetical protein